MRGFAAATSGTAKVKLNWLFVPDGAVLDNAAGSTATLDWTPDDLADAILLDAPCTATGTVRRHPDILWSKREEDVKSLAELQARLIDKALTLLKPSGLLVYCTCSLQPEEGERQAAAALSRNDGLERLPIAAAEIGGLAAFTRDGDLHTHPAMLAAEGGMDGFFAARFRKA